MEQIKRIEIVIDALEVGGILKTLDTMGVTGYTVMNNVTGKGGRGIKRNDELTGVFSNSYILTTCTAEQLPSITNALRPILKRFGGLCLVSDAQTLLH